jgi:hypothetical protein
MSNQDPLCNPPLLDSSLFPTGSTLATQGSDYNILPFLCNLVNLATNPNVDPVLVTPPAYDWTPHVNFSALTGVGDPRFSDGAILSACFTEFLPKILTQLEVKKAGGYQVVDTYICDADGNPILTKTEQPIQTTVGNGNINLYGYQIGSVTTEQLMEPITEQSIATFYANYIQSQQNIYAGAFATYINTVYTPTACKNNVFSSNGWRATLNTTSIFPLFYVQLDFLINGNVDHSVYLKYYNDSQQAVLNNLISLNYIPNNSVINVQPTMKASSNAMIAMVMNPIPDYTNTNNFVNIATNQVNMFSASVLQNYTNQYSTFIKNPSAFKATYKLS